jgi:hypothetical protein
MAAVANDPVSIGFNVNMGAIGFTANATARTKCVKIIVEGTRGHLVNIHGIDSLIAAFIRTYFCGDRAS